MPIRLGRWHAEIHRRGLWITREPDPNCAHCSGRGGHWRLVGTGAELDECHCLDQLRTWRLPLWPRRPEPIERPF
jgi:hypothetical protein